MWVTAGMSDRGTFNWSIPQRALLVRHGDLPLRPDRRDQQHVRRVAVELEEVRDALPQHARREGPEAFAELDLDVHLRLHARAARIAKDAAGAERARAELHATIEPADD